MLRAFGSCLASFTKFEERNGSESRSSLSVTWSFCGVSSIAAAVTLGLWIALDPVMADAGNSLAGSFRYSLTSFCRCILELNGLRRYGMFALLGYAVVSSFVWIVLMLFGRSSDRSLRSFLVFTGTFAIWLACIGSWNEIAWMGKRWRADRYVTAFEPIAAALKSDWPSSSGEQKLIGLYMSYPTTRPQSMILMECPKISGCPVSFNGIERTPDGGLAFALVGNDGGDWLEWHPTGYQPESFVTGLQQNKEIHRSAKLKPGWFLVRYAP